MEFVSLQFDRQNKKATGKPQDLFATAILPYILNDLFDNCQHFLGVVFSKPIPRVQISAIVSSNALQTVLRLIEAPVNPTLVNKDVFQLLGKSQLN